MAETNDKGTLKKNPVIGEDLGQVGPNSDAATDGTTTPRQHEDDVAGENRRRDPEDRPTGSERAGRDKGLDKTLADSFPTSDPPSTIPDPDL